MSIGAARSVTNTLLAIGVVTLLVVLCCGCALGAKSSARDESHSVVVAAKAEETERQVVATSERGPVTRTTLTPVVVTVNGQERLVNAIKRTHYGPARSALASTTKAKATSVTDTRVETVKVETHAWHFGPPWWAGVVAVVAAGSLSRWGPALWNFAKGLVWPPRPVP